MAESIRTVVYLSPEDHARAKAYGDRTGLSLSSLARFALIAFLDREGAPPAPAATRPTEGEGEAS